MDAAVEKAKRKAIAELDAALPSNMKKKGRNGFFNAAGAKEATQERGAKGKTAARGAKEDGRWLGWLGTLKRRRGKLLVEAEVKSMLFHYYHMRYHDGVKSGAAMAQVAALHGTSGTTLRRCVESYEANDGKIVVKDGAGRGRTERSSLLPDTQQRMEQYIAAKNKIGTPVNAKGVRVWLVSAPAINDKAGENTGGSRAEAIPEYDKGRDAIEVSVATVRRWLAKMGYQRMEGTTGYTLRNIGA